LCRRRDTFKTVGLNMSVTITAAKATLFAGETQTSVATVVGIADKTVSWAVDEKNGGKITELRQYTAPKIQGIYHRTATTRGQPQTSAAFGRYSRACRRETLPNAAF